MTNSSGLWEFLSRDVAFLGGLQSPMLSWLGSFGILLFFLWHVTKFRKEILSVRSGFEQVRPMLAALVKERGDIDRERFNHRSEKRSTSQVSRNDDSNARIDCNDLETIDTGMAKNPMFRSAWAQYRMTLILERVPWFLDPRIFSTKRAEEVFTQEALMTNRINLSFYSQFPSLVTGIGLLFTFLALFIGLGKLHAEGSEILGIQGLINGLAGKFLTSIVGLIAANIFTFIEKPLVSQLMGAHHSFLGLVDQLFPRKTMEQMLEQLTSMHSERQRDRVTSSKEIHEPGGEGEMNGLIEPTAYQTSVTQSLTKRQEDEHAETRQIISELPRLIRKELDAPLRELTDTIQDLSKVLKETKKQHVQEEPAFDHHPPLWRASSNLVTSSGANRSGKAKTWPRWPRSATERRTA